MRDQGILFSQEQQLAHLATPAFPSLTWWGLRGEEPSRVFLLMHYCRYCSVLRSILSVCCAPFEHLELQKRGNGHTGLTGILGVMKGIELRDCPLARVPEWIRGPLQDTLGSAASLEERQGAEEVGLQGGCHPALGKMISLNAVSGNVADCGTFLFAPEMRPVEVQSINNYLSSARAFALCLALCPSPRSIQQGQGEGNKRRCLWLT